ncbi:hypothetical protein H6503_00125 [Candidatus Woesearchaeota archaeon]|nr:hypothetical protein [Candidatus Woesearchaeota archaeon]
MAFKPWNMFLKEYNLKHDQLKEDLGDEYGTYLRLKDWFKGKQLSKKKLTVYYPGSGSDFSSLLLILDAVSDHRKLKDIEITFLDIRDFYDGILNQLHRYAPGVWIVNNVSKDKFSSIAYYKNLTIKISYYIKDAESFFPPELKDNTDIYYERAFELFRSKNSMMNYKFLKNIKPLGFAMTDHSFDFGSQKRLFKQLKGIPKGFGLYNNFQIWQKIK